MTPALTETRRIIAVGDVHGCIATLQQLIETINPERGEQLVFLGDLIGRGTHSKKVLDYVTSLAADCSCHFIMGNHELMYLQYLENQSLKGESKKHPDMLKLSGKHLDFLRSFRYFIETESWFFTHGGLDPELSVKDNLRYYKPEEFCWQRVHMRSSFRESGSYRWEKTVVCAHTTVHEPVLLERLIAIDTGCVYKDKPNLGKLTAVILPERRIIQTKNRD